MRTRRSEPPTIGLSDYVLTHCQKLMNKAEIIQFILRFYLNSSRVTAKIRERGGNSLNRNNNMFVVSLNEGFF